MNLTLGNGWTGSVCVNLTEYNAAVAGFNSQMNLLLFIVLVLSLVVFWFVADVPGLVEKFQKRRPF